MGASPSHEDEVGRLLGWSERPCIRLMPGGASGQTYAVTAQSDTDTIVCAARRLRPSIDANLVGVTRALAESGIAPRVLAASSDWLIQEFVRDAEAPPSALNDAASGVATRVGALVRRLHALPHTGLDDTTFPHCADELGRWIEKAKPALAAGGEGALEALECERVHALANIGSGDAWRTIVAHGDLHPGNILLGKGGDGGACTLVGASCEFSLVLEVTRLALSSTCSHRAGGF
jgi:aminoglycoside phosphotransferase (APT) family kinase protein